MTSTLQQEASRKLRFSAQTTMRVAQRLYENGHITYMRTDSTTLSESALTAARAQAARAVRRRHVPGGAAALRAQGRRTRRRRTRRSGPPATSSARRRSCARELSRDELALYDLIWKRTVASQMKDARGQTVSMRARRDDRRRARTPSSRASRHRDHVPAASCRLRGGPRRRRAEEDEERRLPALAEGDAARRARRSSRRATRRARPRATPRRPRQRARGARHRPPVDVRVDHRHDPRPRLRLQEGHGARPDVPRLRGRRSCSSSTSAGSSTTTSPRGWRTTSTASPRATRSASSGCAASTSATATPGLHALVTELGGIDAREVNSIAIPAHGHRPPRRPLRPVPRARRGSARASPTTSPPTS